MANHSDAMVSEFLHYNRWANLSLLDACLVLTPDQLSLSVPGVYGSIYDTVMHIVKAEAGYYRRLAGVGLDSPFEWGSNPPLSKIRPYAEQVSSALVESAEQMRDTDSFPRDWDDPGWEGTSARFKSVGLLIQVVNHGIEHRTNITTIMSAKGIQAPGLDGWEYMRLNLDRLGVS